MTDRDIQYADWRDQHESDQYPFADNATMQNEAGQEIGKGIFLDAKIYAIGGGPRQYMSKINRQADDITVTISDSVGELAAGSIDFTSTDGILPLYDQYSRPAGVMVLDVLALATFSGWALGEHEFSIDDTPLAATVVVPTPQLGVRGFALEDGSFITKDAWLVGGAGIVLSEAGAGIIRVDIVGDPLFLRRKCEEEGIFEPPRFLQTINKMGPSAYGDFKIVSGSDEEYATDNVLRVEATSQGIKISAANI